VNGLFRPALAVALFVVAAGGAEARAQSPGGYTTRYAYPRAYRDPGEPIMGVYQSYLGVRPPPNAYPWSYGPGYNPNSLYYHNRLRPVYVFPGRRRAVVRRY